MISWIQDISGGCSLNSVIRIVLIALILSVISISCIACAGYDKIGDILADVENYNGQEVSVKGYVGDTLWFSILDKGAYEIGDGTGTIWVSTSTPPPQEGEEISVKGTVAPAFTLGTSSLGTVIEETQRK